MRHLFSKIKGWVKRHIVDVLPNDDEHEFSEKYRH